GSCGRRLKPRRAGRIRWARPSRPTRPRGRHAPSSARAGLPPGAGSPREFREPVVTTQLIAAKDGACFDCQTAGLVVTKDCALRDANGNSAVTITREEHGHGRPAGDESDASRRPREAGG